jgi:dTDP-4-dehydrorhamnose reductase
MKILVLGAGGMAGHVISLYLRENGHEVDTLSAKNPLDKETLLVDVMKLDRLESVLTAKDYDVVVNCIGLLVKASDEHRDKAAFLNAFLPNFLEARYKDSATRVIHLSTDCVFSGKNPPYQESSPYDGEIFYDRSKALGEIINDKDLTFRMSIIGPDMQKNGSGLFNWFYAQSGEISGYTRAIWSGVTTIELAKGIDAALKQNLNGLYHLVPSTSTSKYELLGTFKDVFARDDITIKADNTAVTLDKTLINTRTDFNYTVPDYRQMVEEMKAWITQHKEHYEHYSR